MATATVSSKGQITIPAEIRNALGISEGAQIDFAVESGHIIAHKVIVMREADVWMMHADVVAEMERSVRDVEQGRISGPMTQNEFLGHLDTLD